MIISNSRNFIYIHLEKTGGTSVEESLTPLLEWNDYIFGGASFGQDIESAFVKNFGWSYLRKNGVWKHSTAKEVQNIVGDKWSEMYKFSTIRDPEKIMKSLYFYKKQQQINDNEKDPHYSFLSYGIDGFIERCLKSNLDSSKTQISKLNYDKSIETFNIDNIDKTWIQILKKINVSQNIELLKINQSKKENIDISNNTKNLIRLHFEEDYDLLDWSK